MHLNLTFGLEVSFESALQMQLRELCRTNCSSVPQVEGAEKTWMIEKPWLVVVGSLIGSTSSCQGLLREGLMRENCCLPMVEKLLLPSSPNFAVVGSFGMAELEEAVGKCQVYSLSGVVRGHCSYFEVGGEGH